MLRLHLRSNLTLAVSVLLGVFLAVFYMKYQLTVSKAVGKIIREKEPHVLKYNKLLVKKHLKKYDDNNPKLQSITGRVIVQESEYLFENVRVLCWVMLTKKHMSDWYSFSRKIPNLSSDKAVRETWGQRCTTILYYANYRSIYVPVIYLNNTHINSWSATRLALGDIFKNFMQNHDWFIRLEEDTYLIMENLVYFLSVYNPDEAYYFGEPYKYWSTLYHHGGPGIVLSRKAMQRLHSVIAKGKCPPSSSYADEVLGDCLALANVPIRDTRDLKGRGRFFVETPYTLLLSGRGWQIPFGKRRIYPLVEVC